jgi:hypothetical protein
VIIRLLVATSGWPLLTGGRCLEVVVETDLAAFFKKFLALGSKVVPAAKPGDERKLLLPSLIRFGWGFFNELYNVF